MDRKFHQYSTRDKWFIVVNYAFLLFLLIIVIYPLIYILSASFSDSRAVMSGKMWLYPVDFTLDGYKGVFSHRGVVRSFLNTIFYVVAGTSINIVLTVMAGYTLSRKDFVGRHLFMFLFVFTMLFSGGLIPTFLLVKDLGLLNTRWALLLPNALVVWNMIITRTYFQMTIPKEMLEASQLDGCNDFRFLLRIVIPLSGPIIAVISLFYAVGHWNQYFSAMIYIRDQTLFPLQLVLREILILNQMNAEMLGEAEAAALQNRADLLKYSLIVVATIPVMLIYPFAQKYFVKGVMIGSLKG